MSIVKIKIVHLDAGGVVPDDVTHPPHLMSALITSDHGPSLRGGLHQGQAGNSQHESQHPEGNNQKNIEIRLKMCT